MPIDRGAGQGDTIDRRQFQPGSDLRDHSTDGDGGGRVDGAAAMDGIHGDDSQGQPVREDDFRRRGSGRRRGRCTSRRRSSSCRVISGSFPTSRSPGTAALPTAGSEAASPARFWFRAAGRWPGRSGGPSPAPEGPAPCSQSPAIHRSCRP